MATNIRQKPQIRPVVTQHNGRLNRQLTDTQLWEHYTVEKELADRLRNATRSERLRLYNEVYDERLQRIPHHPLATQAADPIARHAAVVPQFQLLRPFLKADQIFMEIGPGDCALSMAVAPHVKRVYAVDVSDGLVQGEARPVNFELCISNGLNIPVAAGSVHLAYSNQLMEHLHPDDAAEQLTNIYTAMAPGGQYVCITPNHLSGPWDISRHFDEVATGFHLHEYTITELASTFRQIGFRRVRIFMSYHGHHLSPQFPVAPVHWLEWGLARMPRKLCRKLAHGLTVFKIIAVK